MSEARFIFKFEGPSVENGEIDINHLAPSLLNIGDLVQAANAIVNGDRAKASVKVRATATGSFEVDLTIIQNIVETIFTYAENHKDEITAANDLADLLLKVGTIAGVPAGGLFFVLKWLKGRKPDKTEEKDGNVTLYIGDNHIITNKKTISLAEDLAVREKVKKVVSVLENEGINSISSRQYDGEVIEIDRSDIPSFRIPDMEEVELLDDTRVVNLQIISLSFKEDNKWRLTDGAEPFSATIEDEEFLKKIADSEISFSKNDYLVCELRERQVRTPTGLKKERNITKVIEHMPAPKQLPLL